MCPLCPRVVVVGGVVTLHPPTHAGGKGGGKPCRCFFDPAQPATNTSTAPCKHPEGGWWWWWVGGAGGCSPCGAPSPHPPRQQQHNTQHRVPPPPCRAVPCRAGGRRVSSCGAARLEGTNVREIQTQTRGNFLGKHKKFWKVVESFSLQLARGVGDKSQSDRDAGGE